MNAEMPKLIAKFTCEGQMDMPSVAVLSPCFSDNQLLVFLTKNGLVCMKDLHCSYSETCPNG